MLKHKTLEHRFVNHQRPAIQGAVQLGAVLDRRGGNFQPVGELQGVLHFESAGELGQLLPVEQLLDGHLEFGGLVARFAGDAEGLGGGNDTGRVGRHLWRSLDGGKDGTGA